MCTLRFFFAGITLWTYSVTFHSTGVKLSWWAIMQAEQTSPVCCGRKRLAHASPLLAHICDYQSNHEFDFLHELVRLDPPDSILHQFSLEPQEVSNISTVTQVPIHYKTAAILTICIDNLINVWLDYISGLQEQISKRDARHLPKSAVRRSKR